MTSDLREDHFHQTTKKYLAKRRPVRTRRGLGAQIDAFVEHDNTQRPHRARGHLTPLEAFSTRDRAGPGHPSPPHIFACAPTVQSGVQVSRLMGIRQLAFGPFRLA